MDASSGYLCRVQTVKRSLIPEGALCHVGVKIR